MGLMLLGLVKSNAFAVFVTSIIGKLFLRGHNKRIQDKESTYTKRMDYIHSIKPYVVEGIKYAERAIPNDHPNKAIAKFDIALNVIGGMLESNKQKSIPALIKQSINEMVDELTYEKKLDGLPPVVVTKPE